MSNIEVGQILFIVFDDKKIIYPVQVIEEITKKTIEGVETDFIFRAGTGKSQRVLSYKSLNGKSFANIEDAKQFLLDIEMREIENQASEALKKADEWYSQI